MFPVFNSLKISLNKHHHFLELSLVLKKTKDFSLVSKQTWTPFYSWNSPIFHVVSSFLLVQMLFPTKTFIVRGLDGSR